MKLETYNLGKYQVVKIHDEKRIDNLSELRDLVYGYLNRGKIHIAIGFSNASYIYSGAISILIDCYKKIQDVGGSLCIIEPDPGLFDILETLNIDRVINIYVSEQYLPQ